MALGIVVTGDITGSVARRPWAPELKPEPPGVDGSTRRARDRDGGLSAADCELDRFIADFLGGGAFADPPKGLGIL